MGPIAGAASGRCAMRFRRIVRVSEWKYALSGRNRRPLREGFETLWQTTLRPGPRRLLWSSRRTISMSCLGNPRRNAEALQSIRDVRALSAKGKAGPTVSERDHALEKCKGGIAAENAFSLPSVTAGFSGRADVGGLRSGEPRRTHGRCTNHPRHLSPRAQKTTFAACGLNVRLAVRWD